MNIGEALELAIKFAEAGKVIAGVVKSTVEQGKVALAADDLAELQALLETLHTKNMAASAALDEALKRAAG